MTYVPLSLTDLVIASVLLIISGGLSLGFRLGLEKTIAVSALRMVVQLAIVALVLKFVFELGSPWWTALIALVMLSAAAFEIVSRQDRKFRGWQSFALASGPPFIAGLAGTMIAAVAVIGGDPWYAPRYILPILGMMLGNAMSGVSLVLDTITDSVTRDRAAIEGRLALGATGFEALGDALRRGVKTGLMPILASMASTGIIALPGMMTGQILAGINPVDAAKYQVMILLLVAGATGIAVFAAGLGAVKLLTDDRHRLRLDRLADKTPV
jgi:putative ABC transport system permease protein